VSTEAEFLFFSAGLRLWGYKIYDSGLWPENLDWLGLKIKLRLWLLDMVSSAEGSCFTTCVKLTKNICLSVCLLATSRKKYLSDCHANCNRDVYMYKEELIKFRKSSASRSGSKNVFKDSRQQCEIGHFSTIWVISANSVKTDRIFVQILSQMYLWQLSPQLISEVIQIQSSNSGYGLQLQTRFALECTLEVLLFDNNYATDWLSGTSRPMRDKHHWTVMSHGMALQYLQTYCEPASTFSSRQLRSAHAGRLTVPRTRTNYGDRSFTVQGPRCGTAFLLNCAHRTYHWTRPETN